VTAKRFTPDGDRHHHYPLLGRAHDAVLAKDLPALGQAYQAAESWSSRVAVMLEAAEFVDESYARSLAALSPQDPWRLTLLGGRLVVAGWEKRGYGWAKSVTAEGARAFLAYLQEAEEVLAQACAVLPDNPSAWVIRLRTARGLGVGLDETRRRYARVAQIDPNNWPAQRQLLQSLYPKWYGSWEEAFEFARYCAASAPPGSAAGSILLDAHLEKRGSLEAAEWDKYFADPSVQEEVDALAARTVFNPAFGSQFGWVEALTKFAVVFSMMKRWPQAQACFEALGPYYHPMTDVWRESWARREFLRYRKKAMRGG
jgi:tetratricopeptide (TPR) repeat protein